MRWLPDTVVARSISILIVALFAVHFLGYWAYQIGVSAVAERAQDRALAERVVSIKRAVANIPDPLERDKAAHALSSGSLEVHWSRISLVLANAPLTERTRATAERLKELVPDLAAESFRIGFVDDGAIASGDAEAYRHMLLISVRLDDQSWVNFSTPRLGTVQHFDPALMALTLCLGIVIVVIAALLLSWVIRPLRGLAEAAERFSLDGEVKPLDESGPLEVRRAARAFNAMRERSARSSANGRRRSLPCRTTSGPDHPRKAALRTAQRSPVQGHDRGGPAGNGEHDRVDARVPEVR